MRARTQISEMSCYYFSLASPYTSPFSLHCPLSPTLHFHILPQPSSHPSKLSLTRCRRICCHLQHPTASPAQLSPLLFSSLTPTASPSLQSSPLFSSSHCLTLSRPPLSLSLLPSTVGSRHLARSCRQPVHVWQRPAIINTGKGGRKPVTGRVHKRPQRALDTTQKQ